MRNSKKNIKYVNTAKKITHDSFQNLTSNFGGSRGSGNMMSESSYVVNAITQKYQVLENAYRGNFVVGLIVDLIAEDMTKKGINIQSELEPEEIKKINELFTKLKIWDSICEALKWSRLYGGSIAVIQIDGDDLTTELDYDAILPHSFKGLAIFDRWMVQPSSETITEFGLDFGNPMYYNLLGDSTNKTVYAKIHHSRVFRFTGIDLPTRQKIREQGWGESVIERIWDRLIAFDSSSIGAAQLAYKSHLRTLKIENLRDILSTGGEAQEGLLSMMKMIQTFQSNEGLTVIDSADDLSSESYSYSGLAEMIDTFLQQIAASTEIPYQRLLGQASSGFGNGEDNLKNYASNIHRKQEQKLRTHIDKLLRIVCLSELNKELPTTDFEFVGLLEQNEKEENETNSIKIKNILDCYDKQLLSQEEARKELEELNIFTNMFNK